MVKAIFKAAQNNDAVLFFDEADSLLSKRLTNVSQGSEQAINSMRSQILICLEEFQGIVIFATNLVINYDKAFLTRLISIEFKIPEKEYREKIWNVHLMPQNDGKVHKLNIPLADDVNITELADKYDFICVEDLNMQAMARGLHLAKATNDNGFGQFRNMLSYKMEERGKKLITIDKWFPSSKTCRHCGYVNSDLTLNDREWVCPSCGAKIDRDVNAAINIKTEGLRNVS